MRILFIISFAILCGCSSEKILSEVSSKKDSEKVEIFLSPDEYFSVINDPNDPNEELCEKDLFDVIARWAKNLEKSTQTRGTANLNPTSYKVLKKFYASKKQDNEVLTRSQKTSNQITISEIEFENNGLPGRAVVAEDGGVPKVLAFIPIYIDSLEKENNATNYMLQISEQALISEIKHKEYVKDSLRVPTINKISNKLKIPVEDVDIKQLSDLLIIEGGSSSKIISTEPDNALQGVGPLSMTQWGGFSPYNKYLPYYTNMQASYDGGIYYDYLGSTISTAVNEAAIAISQLLAIHQPFMVCNGTVVHWDYLLETPDLFEPDPNFRYIGPMPEIAPEDKCQMVGELFKYVSDCLNTNYVLTGSGNRKYYKAYITASNIESFFRKHFTANINNWDTNAVIRSLQNFSLVVAYVVISNAEIIRSAQYTFLVDGYRMCQDKENAPIDIYLHINQGRGSSGNGYFYVNKNFTVNFSFEGVDYPLTADTMIAVTDIDLKSFSI